MSSNSLANFFNLGRSLAGTMAYEDIRTVGFLAKHFHQADRQILIGVLDFLWSVSCLAVSGIIG